MLEHIYNKSKLQNREDLLNDTIQYYSVNPNERRSVSDKDRYTCFYSQKNSKKPHSNGCAIGRYHSEEWKLKADDLQNAHEPFQKIIEDSTLNNFNTDFLEAIQQLHDENVNWNSTGLSPIGFKFVDAIIERFIPIKV